MRVTLVIATLGGGGAERVAANMANCWAAKGWAVAIVTTCFGDHPSSYDLDPRVTRIDVESRRLNRLPRDPRESAPLAGLLADCSPAERAALIPQTTHLMKLRETILATRPQVVISYIDVTNLCVLSATRGSGLPVIVSEQCDPNHNFIGDGWELLRRRLYPQARYVAVLTEESLGYFSGVAGIRGRVIPNPLTPFAFSGSDERPQRKDGKTLMAMGRLAQEKGFDLLLQAFALVAGGMPTGRWRSWGKGHFARTSNHASRSSTSEGECDCRDSHASRLMRSAAPTCLCCRRYAKAFRTCFSKRWPAGLRS